MRRRFYAALKRAGLEPHPFPRPASHLRHARGSGISTHRREGIHGPRRHPDDDDLRAPRPPARRRRPALADRGGLRRLPAAHRQSRTRGGVSRGSPGQMSGVETVALGLAAVSALSAASSAWFSRRAVERSHTSVRVAFYCDLQCRRCQVPSTRSAYAFTTTGQGLPSTSASRSPQSVGFRLPRACTWFRLFPRSSRGRWCLPGRSTAWRSSGTMNSELRSTRASRTIGMSSSATATV